MLRTNHPGALSATEAVSITLRVALEHHQSGRLREAAALYQEVQSMDAENPDAVFLLGLIALTVRNDAAAHRLLQVASQRLPKSAQVHHALGEALYRIGRLGGALESYWRALSLDACNAAAYVKVAEVLIAMKPTGGNDALAAACLRKALHFDPSSIAAHTGLGHIHLRAGRPEAAEAKYRAAIVLDAQIASSYNSLGIALYQQKQYSAAADAYRHAVTLKPRSPEVFLNMGNAIRDLGDSPRAEECYRRAILLRPRFSAALRSLASLLRARGENRLASACYRQLLAVHADADGWCDLGATLADAEEWLEARDAYDEALRLSPGHPGASLALSRLPGAGLQYSLSPESLTLTEASPVQ